MMTENRFSLTDLINESNEYIARNNSFGIADQNNDIADDVATTIMASADIPATMEGFGQLREALGTAIHQRHAPIHSHDHVKFFRDRQEADHKFIASNIVIDDMNRRRQELAQTTIRSCRNTIKLIKAVLKPLMLIKGVAEAVDLLDNLGSLLDILYAPSENTKQE